jgi:nitrogenase molybdenum-iron protein alpha chain
MAKVRRSRMSAPRCEGKLAMLFVGGSRAHHYQELFGEIGMPTIAAGYEFAHRDDYEGRRVLPNSRWTPTPQHRGVARRGRSGKLPSP